jgi:hypothetical protein
VSKLNTLDYSRGIFYLTVVPDICNLEQYINIFILYLFKSLKRLELIFILLFFIFYFYYSILFDSIIYNKRLYNKEATGINLQLKELRILV